MNYYHYFAWSSSSLTEKVTSKLTPKLMPSSTKTGVFKEDFMIVTQFKSKSIYTAQTE